jgi:hypothetical protein
MNEHTDLSKIQPGMTVFGSDGEKLGPVESIGNDGTIQVLTHAVPSAAIARVDSTGIHLHVAKAAFAAAPPVTRDAATAAEH